MFVIELYVDQKQKKIRSHIQLNADLIHLDKTISCQSYREGNVI